MLLNFNTISHIKQWGTATVIGQQISHTSLYHILWTFTSLSLRVFTEEEIQSQIIIKQAIYY